MQNTPIVTGTLSALDKGGSGSWNFLEPPEVLSALPGCYDSQGETNSIVKVKEKPELYFCRQTDDDNSLWPGIIRGSSIIAPKLQFEISPMGWMSGTLSLLRLQITDSEGLFKYGCRLSAQFDDVYAALSLLFSH